MGSRVEWLGLGIGKRRGIDVDNVGVGNFGVESVGLRILNFFAVFFRARTSFIFLFINIFIVRVVVVIGVDVGVDMNVGVIPFGLSILC